MAKIKDDIFRFAKQRFNVSPDYPWAKYPEFAVLRHSDNKKWFALIMTVPGNRIGMNTDKTIDIMNVKCAVGLMGALLGSPGYRPAYHMSKANWITVLLDGTVDETEIFNIIELSFNLTQTKPGKK